MHIVLNMPIQKKNILLSCLKTPRLEVIYEDAMEDMEALNGDITISMKTVMMTELPLLMNGDVKSIIPVPPPLPPKQVPVPAAPCRSRPRLRSPNTMVRRCPPPTRNSTNEPPAPNTSKSTRKIEKPKVLTESAADSACRTQAADCKEVSNEANTKKVANPSKTDATNNVEDPLENIKLIAVRGRPSPYKKYFRKRRLNDIIVFEDPEGERAAELEYLQDGQQLNRLNHIYFKSTWNLSEPMDEDTDDTDSDDNDCNNDVGKNNNIAELTLVKSA